MTFSAEPLNCPSRNRISAAAPGYALLALMIMVAVLLITVGAALPSVYQAGQREREAEAIFCGNQYARSVYLFYRRFGRYPTSVKDLLNTDGVRYLRKPYGDPLARDGKWRFIHAAAGGVLIDSWKQTTILPGLAAGSGGAGPVGATGNNTGAGSAVATAGNTLPGQNTPGAPTPEGGKAKHPPSTCDSSGGDSTAQYNGKSYQTGVLMGAFIVGVAPCNAKESIRVLDHQDHYDHWEFVGLNYHEYSLPKAGLAGAQPAGTAGSQFSNQPPSSNGENLPGPPQPQP